jgi:hypothetical protein
MVSVTYVVPQDSLDCHKGNQWTVRRVPRERFLKKFPHMNKKRIVSARRSQKKAWLAFKNRHAGHPFLNAVTVYALTTEIIDAIKMHVPRLFTRRDEQFERELVGITPFCFFHKNQLGGYLSKEKEPKTGLTYEERDRQVAASLREMMFDEMLQAGVSSHEITEHFSAAARTKKIILDRKSAYTAWLVTNAEYRSEVSQLRHDWEPLVEKLGCFPHYPRFLDMNDACGYHFEQPFLQACLNLYRRWGLDRLATWDWPIPMEPDFNIRRIQTLDELAETGMSLFLPWYLLRGEKLSLQAIARSIRLYSAADHLRTWLAFDKRRSRDGEIRYRATLFLYQYFVLALRARYAASPEFNLEKIDVAFARLLKRSADSVKKLRLKLQKALSLS